MSDAHVVTYVSGVGAPLMSLSSRLAGQSLAGLGEDPDKWTTWLQTDYPKLMDAHRAEAARVAAAKEGAASAADPAPATTPKAQN